MQVDKALNWFRCGQISSRFLGLAIFQWKCLNLSLKLLFIIFCRMNAFKEL